MSERALKALVGTVAGLFLLWLLVSFFPSGGGGAGGPSESLSGFFEGITPESVTTVRFVGPERDSPVELSRQGSEWTVNGFRADSTNLATFWEAMDGAEVGDLVASNPANHRRMGLASDSTWSMEVQTAGGSRSLLIGNTGTRYGTTFVRQPSEDAVHSLGGNVRPNLTRSLDDWRNKRIAAVDTSGVWRIEAEMEEGGFAVQRSDSLWVLEDGAEANATTVRSILGEMARLDATGFYEAGDSLAASGGFLRALDQEGNVQFSLEMGSGDGDRWVVVEGDSITYRVASWRANRILPDLEQVRGGG